MREIGDLEVAIEFAGIELIELKRGDRNLSQCPGLRKIGEAIRSNDETNKRLAKRARAASRRDCGS